MEISQSAVGHGAKVTVAASDQEKRLHARRADVGVITILGKEASAVHAVLDLQRAQTGDLPFFEGTVNVRGTVTRVAAIRALSQGQRSTVVAFDHLRRHYNPAIIVLAGIGGGIHADTALGDVVVTTRVVYYDLRKETPEGRKRRGEEREAPSAVGHAINSFFTDYGEPARFQITDDEGVTRDYRVHAGPIGSGDAVIADAESEIIRYLKAFNDKILAVDMEAGGLTQAFHEQDGSQAVRGWIVVRGISDDASPRKNDDYHDIAARHAATVLRNLLPYLRVDRV
ncbi:hypothetical protein [Planomonospora venezuelensis]|uniref:Adenosylhomocysteine nucleosidase n=1 Tax=Planomonospora venezuelensis TaxID=1999 RepID=A0A841D0M0_PLAVE|nr:hypothetical protein [Planomonospora venezuelensis]MBB5962543.1 adenosylhomocysteine nucleosidase [Planomonospora venezuelensis]